MSLIPPPYRMPHTHPKSRRSGRMWWRARAPRRQAKETLAPVFAASLVAASFVYDRLFSMDGVSLCPLLRATGAPCPMCGMTRAFVALADGDVSAALQAHPLAVWLYAWLLLAVVAWGVRWVRNRPPHPWFWRASGLVLAVALATRWVILLIT